jgi:hypothetical protein
MPIWVAKKMPPPPPPPGGGGGCYIIPPPLGAVKPEKNIYLLIKVQVGTIPLAVTQGGKQRSLPFGEAFVVVLTQEHGSSCVR